MQVTWKTCIQLCIYVGACVCIYICTCRPIPIVWSFAKGGSLINGGLVLGFRASPSSDQDEPRPQWGRSRGQAGLEGSGWALCIHMYFYLDLCLYPYLHFHPYMYMHRYLYTYIYTYICSSPLHDPYLRVLLVWILDHGRRDASKHCNAQKIWKFWCVRCTKHCNAQKNLKILKFRDLSPSSLHSLENFRIFGFFWALQCLVHLTPQNFQIFWALRCFVALRCAKHCNAQKILKILKFRDLWPSSLHSLENFRIFVFFEHYSVWCTSHPRIFRFFEHCGVS